MLMTSAVKECRSLCFSLILIMGCMIASPALGGAYRDSAHGNAIYGVNRSALDGRYAYYAVGNCAHCHEMHASLEGVEPVPSTGPAPHAVFAESFNTDRIQSPYQESDNFCFYCHSDSSSQQVINRDYSTTFGGGNIAFGPQSIMAAFNQTSYHNLYDIWNFLSTDPTYSTWFAALGNPCSACHDSHLAKRNWDGAQPGFPLLSTIIMPGGSGNLWGETEVMSAYFGYEAPYAFSPSREPAGLGDQDGGNTSDYVSFCASCHNQNTTISSTTLTRNLKYINWGSIGLYQDKHGDLSRNGTDHFREPYATAATGKSNFVLSCLDCHESHGSANIMMLRTRINGEDQEGLVISTDAMSYTCKRCHNDDLAETAVLGATAGTGEADRWQYVHHGATDAPYSATGQCEVCHSSGAGGDPIACGNCHGHGMDDSWAPTQGTGRKTF
jgi:hypothetical protein